MSFQSAPCHPSGLSLPFVFCVLLSTKVTGQAPFSVDFVVRASTGKTEDQPSAAGEEASPPPIPSVVVSDWLTTGSRTFSDRFRETFSLEDKGFRLEDVAAAKAALSNMLGGFGYFTGRTEVRGAGLNGRSGYSFEARLFTGVPSRSFFPRGFLWDEGFHQVRRPRPVSVDVDLCQLPDLSEMQRWRGQTYVLRFLAQATLLN